MDGIRIPEAMRRVLEHIASHPEADWRKPWELAHARASLFYDLAPELLRAGLSSASETEGPAKELDYLDTPFELVPVSWNGGDGLHYDWVVHAPELDLSTFPMVSFAPGEDGAVWLGDSTSEGLSHLMVGVRKGRLGQGLEDPLGTEMWETLARLLGRAPDPDEPRITEGARSGLFCSPSIPEGYRFEDGPDGVGVLAPTELFGGLDFEAMPGDPELFERESLRLAAEGLHAGALSLLKNLRSWTPDDVGIVRRMAAQYVGLGRPMHARRAEVWAKRREG